MFGIAEWIEHYALPCIYQQCFGFCCPFCGFQRSVIALCRGDIVQSVLYYPALFPMLLSVVGILFIQNERRKTYLKWCGIINVSIILIATFIKNMGWLPK